MNTKQRIAELEKELAELRKTEKAPDLLRIGGKAQSIKFNGYLDKGRQVSQNGKVYWVSPIQLIEVEEK